MTSKQIFTELVQRIGAGGNVRDDFPFTLGDILPHLDYAYSTAVKYRMNEEYSATRVWRVDSSLSRGYQIEVKDGQAELPVSIVRLPNDLGVHQVGFKANKYHRTTPDYESRFDGLLAKSISSRPKFWVEDNSIAFYNIPASVECVDVRLIPLPSSLAEDDEIFFPAGMENMVIDTVIQRMGFAVQIPEDKSNDGQK